jgi:hypothetical protein
MCYKNSAMRPGFLFAVLAMMSLSAQAALGQCKPVDMKAYSLCFPEKWHLEKSPTPGKGSGCSKITGACTNSAGAPLPDLIVFSIRPFEGPGDLSAAITKVDPHVSSKESPAELASGALTGQIEYVASRTLLPNKVWNDVYAIETGSKIIILEAHYNDESGKIDRYRQTIFGILASVTVKKD